MIIYEHNSNLRRKSDRQQKIGRRHFYKIHRRQEGILEQNPPGFVREQDRILRSRLHVVERSGEIFQLESQLRRNRSDVAWWLHHQKRIFRQHQERLHEKSEFV